MDIDEFLQAKEFVEKNELMGTVGSPVSAGAAKYQPLLDEHILDCLELAVLSCEISYLSEGQSEQV